MRGKKGEVLVAVLWSAFTLVADLPFAVWLMRLCDDQCRSRSPGGLGLCVGRDFFERATTQ